MPLQGPIVRRGAALNAEQPDADRVAEIVGDLLQFGRGDVARRPCRRARRSKCRLLPGLMPTMRCIWPKLSMVDCRRCSRPRSPGLKPCLLGSASGIDDIHLGRRVCSPKKVKMAVKMAMASRKLAIGPAATIAARAHKRLAPGSCACGPPRRKPLVGLAAGLRARDILVVDEFHIAAERDPRQPPACAVAVVEAEDLRPEADRENLDGDAAPARHEEMTELVEEHDDGQDEKEGQEVREQGGVERPEELELPVL